MDLLPLYQMWSDWLDRHGPDPKAGLKYDRPDEGSFAPNGSAVGPVREDSAALQSEIRYRLHKADVQLRFSDPCPDRFR